jgi:hypothetical protein
MDWIIDERREDKRYSLEMRLRYRVTQGTRTIWRGSGFTTDLSRKSIRMTASRPLPADSRIELVIDWPVRFADMYPMELAVSGTIERSEGNDVVVRMISWQFRIAPGARSFETERAQGWAPRARMRDEVPVAATAVM